jgi:hypothetical protein
MPSNEIPKDIKASLNKTDERLVYLALRGVFLGPDRPRMDHRRQHPFLKDEFDYFRRLLAFIGCNLRLEDHIPSRMTLSRWIGKAYDQQFVAIKEVVRSAATRISLSFDLWTSYNQLALLGLVAHFLDHSGVPKTVLLSLPRQKGRHCGHRILETIAEVIREFDIGNKLGYFITGNVSSNATTCLHSTRFPTLSTPSSTYRLRSAAATKRTEERTED